MSDTVYYIYVLIDPRTHEERYIGKTNNIARRFREHCQPQWENNRRARWLNLLRDLHMKPLVKILEKCDSVCWSAKEVHYKKYYESLGCDLTNTDEGGLGRSSGYKMPSESKEKISKANKGKYPSEETRRKMSESKRGNSNRLGIPHTLETKIKMSKAGKGRVLSHEHRNRLSEALRGEKNPNFGKTASEETRRKISEAGKGRTHSEETKEKIRIANKGQKPSNSKLTESDVRSIKAMLRSETPIKEIAELYPVSSSQIINIDKGKSWGYVE